MALKRIGRSTDKIISNMLRRTSFKLPDRLCQAFAQRMEEDGVSPRFKSRQINTAIHALLKQNNPVYTVQHGFVDIEVLADAPIVALSLKEELIDSIEEHVKNSRNSPRESLAALGETEILASPQQVTLSSFVRTAMALWACRFL